ncbi:amidohydrolase family protein [Shimia thalassica]|uniref:amidohydrolase family protein n=1 Tax=Shimia thalassica TaxID=1715693 RepID=UPI0026E2AB3A|nr:amidohydrolase family protein [Shimia thalassica]MDO6485677.1 amidohydrolase family protein [Shimia thalassica]
MFRTLTGRAPVSALPPLATDCHIHLFDSARYSDQPNGPTAPADALISHYEQVQKWLGLERVVIVQGNAYQKDNRCLLEGLDHFGSAARGVVAVSADISDEDLHQMTAKGVRGARIMNILQGAVGLDEMLEVNARVYPFGWSLIVQFDGRDILAQMAKLETIKGDYVIDHTGKFLEPVTTGSAEFAALLRLVDRGNCFVKLAGCYETSKIGHPGFDDLAALSKALIQHAPDRIIWGTNWPHNMSNSRETYPDDVHLLDLAMDWAGSRENIQKIFVDTPAQLYGFS